MKSDVPSSCGCEIASKWTHFTFQPTHVFNVVIRGSCAGSLSQLSPSLPE